MIHISILICFDFDQLILSYRETPSVLSQFLSFWVPLYEKTNKLNVKVSKLYAICEK